MNGIIVLNKAQDFTSMDCCAILRGILHEKKIGHTGTLDPNATGVLVVCFGKATRLIEYFEPLNKRYIAKFRLGYTSDTEDVWGNVKKISDNQYTADEVKKLLPHGEIDQIPPMYSAKQVNGQRLYDLARNGQNIERKSCKVHIEKCELLEFDGTDGVLDIECSSGTYVRTICADLGKALGSGAIMTSLVRTQNSGYSLENSLDMSLVMKLKEDQADASALMPYIIPIDKAMDSFPSVNVNDHCLKLLLNGNPKALDDIPNILKMGHIVTLYYSGKLVAIVKDGVIDKVFNEDF